MSPEAVDGTVCGRKQLMENAATHRQPVQLSESGGDVITPSLPQHDPRRCVLDCLQRLDLRLWQSSYEATAIAQLGQNQANCYSIRSFADEQ